MNINGANTEPYYRFLRAHEDLGTNIKLAYGALHAIGEDEKSMISSAKTSFIALPTGGEPWGKNTRWRSVKARIPKARKLISEMGLVLAASAFEDFLTNVVSDHDRFADFAQKKSAPKATGEEESENHERLGPFFNSLQWDITAIEFLLPLFDYFVIVRNCVVHRSGRATASLVEKAESSALAQCIKYWPSRPGKRIPQLPPIHEGRDIPLLPRHVILFSEVCQRIGLYINSRLLEFLDVQGLVYLAAHHSLLSENRIQTLARNSPEQVINFVMTDRCQVQLSDKFEVIRILKEIGLWKECRQKYGQLFGKSV